MGPTCGGSPPAAAVPGRSTVRTLAVVSFVSSYDRFAMAPLLFVIAADLGVSVGAVAASAAGYYLAYGITQPGWGLLSERIGRVAVMRWGLAGAAVAGFVSIAAPDLATLTVIRCVAGGCFSAVIPAALVYVGDSWPEPVRQRPMSDVLAATSIGTTVGTLGAGLIAQLSTWRLGFAVAAVAAAALWVRLRRLPEPAGARSAEAPATLLRRVFAEPWAVVVLSLALVEGVVLVAAFLYLAPALESSGVSVGVAGAAAGTFGVGVLGGAQVVKVLVGRLPAARLLVIGGTLITLGWFPPLLGIGIGTVLMTGLLLGIGWSFFHSTMQSWATDVVPAARATTISLFVAALFVGSAIGAALVTPLIDARAFAVIFLIALVVTVPLTVMAAAARSRYAGR